VFSYNLFDSTRIAGGFLSHAYSFLLEKLIYNAFNRLKPNTAKRRKQPAAKAGCFLLFYPAVNPVIR
ncbi:hypothetical protein ACTQ56_11010, partial [[Clostridium] aminophilum]|uniref:hypothetical protein n=1 Tax=[Clostridium] aminophilum TaxID=1526 RepID=UPI003F9B4F87